MYFQSWRLVTEDLLKLLNSKLIEKLPTFIQAFERKMVDFAPHLGRFLQLWNMAFYMENPQKSVLIARDCKLWFVFPSNTYLCKKLKISKTRASWLRLFSILGQIERISWNQWVQTFLNLWNFVLGLTSAIWRVFSKFLFFFAKLHFQRTL